MHNNQIIAFDSKANNVNKIYGETRYQYAGGHFQLTGKGVYYLGKDKDGCVLPSRWICSPLHVIAKTRDVSNGEWGRLLEWLDDDGVIHQWAMPLAMLQGDCSLVRQALVSLGLTISPSRSARELLGAYLQVVPVAARARCVEKLGWHDNVFVTGKRAIGQSVEKIVFQNSNAIKPTLSTSGSLQEWKDNIAQLARGNSRLLFAISCAILKFSSEDSGGFHFRGASSSGKSTALKMAASVWGKPSSYCRLWRATSNGLEGLAALHNDGLLILDELSQVEPREAGEAAYLLANGQGKNRASKTGSLKSSSQWSLLFLSAGEESLTTLMAKAGQRTNAGQEIRLADIEADAGCYMGIFENTHDQLSPTSMALTLNRHAHQYYGTVGEAWLHKVVAYQHNLTKFIATTTQQFLDNTLPNKPTGQVIRVARRFALVGAAGALTSRFGLTGWTEGEAITAAETCFNAWLECFGAEGSREELAIKHK